MIKRSNFRRSKVFDNYFYEIERVIFQEIRSFIISFIISSVRSGYIRVGQDRL